MSEARATPGDDHVTSILDTPQAGPRRDSGDGAARWWLCGRRTSRNRFGAVALRYLGVVDAGRLITVLALVTIVGGISDLGLSSIAVSEYATLQPGKRDEAMRNILGLRLVLAVAGILAATLFALAADYPAVMVVGTTIAGSAILVDRRPTEPRGLALRTSSTWVGDGAHTAWIPRRGRRIRCPLAGGRRTARVLRRPAHLARPRAGPDVHARPWGVPVLPRWMRPSLAKDDPRHRPVRGCGRLLRPLLPLRCYCGLIALNRPGDWVLRRFLPDHRRADVDPGAARLSAFPLLARAARDDRERLHYAIGRLSQGMLILGAWIAVGASTRCATRDRGRCRTRIRAGRRTPPHPVRCAPRDVTPRRVGVRPSLARASSRDHAWRTPCRRAGRRTQHCARSAFRGGGCGCLARGGRTCLRRQLRRGAQAL